MFPFSTTVFTGFRSHRSTLNFGTFSDRSLYTLVPDSPVDLLGPLRLLYIGDNLYHRPSCHFLSLWNLNEQRDRDGDWRVITQKHRLGFDFGSLYPSSTTGLCSRGDLMSLSPLLSIPCVLVVSVIQNLLTNKILLFLTRKGQMIKVLYRKRIKYHPKVFINKLPNYYSHRGLYIRII